MALAARLEHNQLISDENASGNRRSRRGANQYTDSNYSKGKRKSKHRDSAHEKRASPPPSGEAVKKEVTC